MAMPLNQLIHESLNLIFPFRIKKLMNSHHLLSFCACLNDLFRQEQTETVSIITYYMT
jgi:hypothetical protein